MANRRRAARSDDDILNHPGDMRLLLAVARGEVRREAGSTGVQAAHLHGGRPVRSDLRRLAADELIRMPISGPPTLDERGRLLLLAIGHVYQP